MTADIAFVQSGYFFAWDPLAAAILTDDSIARFTDMNIAVVQELDEEDDHSGQLLESPAGAPMRVAMWADAAAFYSHWLDVINGSFA
jgi:inosine-uridine nucleoside N-ribohydrolase